MENDLKNALPGLLRQQGWSEDALRHLWTHTIDVTPITDLVPKAEG
jgi:hypothetical protein